MSGMSTELVNQVRYFKIMMGNWKKCIANGRIFTIS